MSGNFWDAKSESGNLHLRNIIIIIVVLGKILYGSFSTQRSHYVKLG